MKKRKATLPLILSLAISGATLAACGGGGSSPCGSDNQSFGISVSAASYTLKVGTPATIITTITPESCRSSMKFDVTDGSIYKQQSSLPPGMVFSNGNITGTPIAPGNYTYAVRIVDVTDYKAFSVLFPTTGAFTVTILE